MAESCVIVRQILYGNAEAINESDNASTMTPYVFNSCAMIGTFRSNIYLLS